MAWKKNPDQNRGDNRITMMFNLTAQDKLALENLVHDLKKSLELDLERIEKQGETIVSHIGPPAFFSQVGINESVLWADGFIKRLNDAKKNQIQAELDQEKTELDESGWNKA